MEYTRALAELIEEFNKFPGVGPKSAQRMAFSLLKKSTEQVQRFLEVVRIAKNDIKYCKYCFNLTSDEVCEICLNNQRDENLLCVVAEVKDLIAIEKTREFRGKYHVLGGLISPLDGISSVDLNINPLVERLKLMQGEIELIFAISPSTEGEATMLFLKRALSQLEIGTAVGDADSRLNRSILVTRLAYGLPLGSDLDYADELTIVKALEARVSI
ncbi:MAG: recombination mediator RecR [Cyanobacteria bacterium REEB446]|nr:recombination mediator RecR [Cyanobacteria bacterium REEB446]